MTLIERRENSISHLEGQDGVDTCEQKEIWML